MKVLVWRARNKGTEACIEHLEGWYLCSVNRKAYGRTKTLLAMQVLLMQNFGIPLEAWKLEEP